VVYFKKKNVDSHQGVATIDQRTNDDDYTLLAVENIKIPPYHAVDVSVQPHRRFAMTDGEETYEISSFKEIPRVANGIISPRDNIIIRAANLSSWTIMIHKGQTLANMKRLTESQVNAIEYGDQSELKRSNDATSEHDAVDLNKTNLDAEQKEKVNQLIQSFPDVFNKQAGRTNKSKHEIQLLPGSRPCNSQPFRYAPARKQVIEENLNDMLKEGIVSPSNSPWASPVILAPKKDGTLRFCVDYRKLNAMTVRDAYPIPRIDDTLDSLQEARFVSTLDLRSGYWQVELDQAAREKTAFVTHKGLFEFNVMPFGLTNAPATFQRLMDVVLAGLKWQCCLVYIDDVVIFSPTFDQHMKDLRKVFEALRSANLTLKASKCQFCREEMQYLGHIITKNGIKPDPALVKAVLEFPQPKKVKDVQSFLGLTGYYRRFIKNYAKIAEPLLAQLRKAMQSNFHLQWTKECTQAMNTLQQRLTNAPIMNTPNFDHPFVLELDACEYGLGAILAQEYGEKKHVIAYASRTLTAAERKYGATEREALAIVWATKHFRPYLEGHKIYIRSDCKALEWMRTAKDVTGRIARWAMKLSTYQIEEIRYRPGRSNANADSLSRNPVEDSTNGGQEIATMETAVNIWENTNILDDIRREQEKDTEIIPIIKQLQKASPSVHTNKRNPNVLINGIVYKIKNCNNRYNQYKQGEKHLLMIPKSMQQKLLRWAHDHPNAGHGGQQKTLFRLATRVFWKSMKKDVFNYVDACSSCQRFKYRNGPLAGPMQLHTVNEPWATIGVDIMGPFPPTASNKRYLLVVVDYFTRWVEMFALRSTTSNDVANVLSNEVFARFGLPRFIVSDNGPQFVSNLFKDFCRTLGIQQKWTANYHPQSNMTERVNRTLKPMIAIYTENRSQSWDKNIQQLAFAIRTSFNETTGETPAMLMFGRELREPIDGLLDAGTSGLPTTSEQSEIDQYRRTLVENLQTAYNIVREHAEIAKLKQKDKYDQHVNYRNFEEGDRVWVEIPRPRTGDQIISGKLQPRYQGPCRITKKLGNQTFAIQRLSDNVNLGATNIDRLKPFIEHETNDDQSCRETDNEDTEIDRDQNETSDEADGHIINRSNQRCTSTRVRRVPARYRE
jgi:transposase InsO family protein